MNDLKIPTHQAKVGMCLSQPVHYDRGQLVLPEKTILTARTIIRLKMYGVEYIVVEKDSIGDLIEISDNAAYIKQVRETLDFKKFDAAHEATVEILKDAFNGLLQVNEKIDASSLLIKVNETIAVSTNSIQVLDMLHCMRDYDDSTYVHCVNVALISHVLGEWLGFSEEVIDLLTLCGLFHDIGKLLMPREILQKPGRLTEYEFDTIKTHPFVGYNIMKDQDMSIHIKNAILQHHEKCDGTGYPHGLKGEEIDQFAKVVTIADIYDAMTANRVYREGLCPFDVIALFEEEGFQKYDPGFLLKFMERIAASYINRQVILSNDEEARIIMINPVVLSRPVVQMGERYVDLSRQNDLTIKHLI